MKIGFIDYFLSEWHANTYPEMFAKYNKKSGKKFEITHAWAELDVSPYDGVTTDEWCKKFGVKKCGTVAELTAAVDCIIILSPDNPEKHLELCLEAFKCGKPVYVDKTFAPSLTVAKQIFECAKKYNTPMFSSSALRYATELDAFKKPVNGVISMGGGGALERYAVHQLEMVERLMGTGAKRVMSLSNGKNKCAVIDYGNSRRVTLNYNPCLDFNIAVDPADGEAAYLPVRSDFFAGLIDATAGFFETKIPPVKEESTLEIIAIIDALLKSQIKLDEWVAV